MSFLPKYTITNKVLFNVKEIVKVSVELNNKKLPQNTYSSLFENTKALSVKALSPEEAKNYINALEKYSKKNSEFNTNLILAIHTEVMKDLSTKNNIGRFKNNGVKNNVKNLVKFVNNSRKELDPLILAGLFYKQFMVLEPFSYGTERTAALCTRVLLRDMDVNIFNLFSFEKLGQVKVKDNTKWLEYFTQVVLEEMLRVQRKIASVGFKYDMKLNKDQERVLKYLKKHQVITDSDYSKITERKKATRVLDFNKLIEQGLIERCGKGRQTYYILK